MGARVEVMQNILSKSRGDGGGDTERRNAKGSPESKHHHCCPTEQATKTIKARLKKMKLFLCIGELGMWSCTLHLRGTVKLYCCEENWKKKKGYESPEEMWDPDTNVY